ncbi:MAG: transcriptional repressor LexA [Myxococcota bacterium]|nr:transcriptional repressor LexA [Myxococcota bacterium]
MGQLPELTPRQQEVFRFIQEKIQEWGYPPTIREIGKHLGIKSTNGVADHLKALKKKGYLRQDGAKSRTLIPTQTDNSNVVTMALGATDNFVSVPILGRVAAGEPILAEEYAEGNLVVDSVLLGTSKKVFALKVVGDSMIEDGIFNNDFIFVKKRSHASAGDIVVVMIENEATVKRFYPEGERIRLQPANAAMSPIFIHQSDFRQVQIIGEVVGVFRRL